MKSYRAILPIGLVAITVSVSWASTYIYQTYTSAWAAGKPESPGDVSCFVDAWGSVKNSCSTNKMWVMSIPNAAINTPNSTTYVKIGENGVGSGSCYMVYADASSYTGNGMGVYFGSVVNFPHVPGTVSLGSFVSYDEAFGYYSLSVYCSIPPNGAVGPVYAYQLE